MSLTGTPKTPRVKNNIEFVCKLINDLSTTVEAQFWGLDKRIKVLEERLNELEEER